MKLVLDAGFAVAWLGGAQRSPALDEFDTRFYAGTLELHAPEQFLVEGANAVWNAVRRGLRTVDEGIAMFAHLRDARVTLHRHGELVAPALDLSMRRGIPVPQAIYVALALREIAPLFTADRKLARAVKDLVEVVEP